jgi:hypothetical protein
MGEPAIATRKWTRLEYDLVRPLSASHGGRERFPPRVRFGSVRPPQGSGADELFT